MFIASDILEGPLLQLWQTIVSFLPRALGALCVFVIGIFIALVLQHVVVKVIALLHVDEFAKKMEIHAQFERVGIRLHIGHLLGWIVKWFFVIGALVGATDLLGWAQVTDYLGQVILFIPNVIITIIILLAGILLGNFVRTIVRSSLEAAKLASADVLSGLAKWAILVFSFMAALVQLHIAPDLIRVLFAGFVFMLSLAGGLAFGLGGKEHASQLISKLKKDISADSSKE